NAFSNNYTVESIKIPSSVNYLGCSAFYNCINLKKVTLPNSIESVKSNTFKNCKKLKTVNLPDTLWEIEQEAFRGCKKLTKFVVPKSLAKIGKKAFMDCKSLKTVDFTENVEGAKISDYALGFYEVTRPHHDYDIEKTKVCKLKGFKVLLNGTNETDFPLEYASQNGFTAILNVSKNAKVIGNIPAGSVAKLRVDGKKVTKITVKKNKVVKVTKSGKVIALQAGKADFTATLSGGKKIKAKFNVQSDPELEYFGVNGVYVKKGKNVTVKLFGKVNSIKNKYTSTSKAKIVSKKNTNKIKIKGLSKGLSTVKVKVNGVKTLKLKVTVI
ncbi:MAG: leucine-rich repeat domain-containing protein, partial [Ruminococcus sp.]|nr:leucine-rich repeat domain-containing protein [Ruminococcus sp.]